MKWYQKRKGRSGAKCSIFYPIDLLEEKEKLVQSLSSEYQQFVTSNQDVVDLNYPVYIKPETIKSLNFDKTPEIQGKLNGIKGQYLFLKIKLYLPI